MDKAAKVLTDYIIYKGVVKEEERQEFEYGFLIALEIGLSLLISFLLAYILHTVVEGILFFVIFIPLRSYAGGLHLERYWSCLTLSCLTFLGIMLISKYCEFGMIYEIFVLLACEFAIYMMYPIDNINRTVEEEEDRYFKSKLKKFLLLDILIAAMCIFLEKESYLLLITATFCMVVITMFIGKMINCKKG